jgi:protein ImuA
VGKDDRGHSPKADCESCKTEHNKNSKVIRMASTHPSSSANTAGKPAHGLVPGLLARVGPIEGRWAPGQDCDCRHTEIFAAAGEASGAGLALAFALNRAAADDRAGPASVPQADDFDQKRWADHKPWADQRPWLWVQDKAARRLGGRPYRAGLPQALRHRLLHVAAESPEDALFALEEGLRCRDLAFVVGEIAGNPRALDFTASRRLSLAAEKHGVPLWLVRLGARRDLGSARMRWEARAAPSPPPRWNGHAPGAPRWHADLFRAHTFQPGHWTLGTKADDRTTLFAEATSPQSTSPESTSEFGAPTATPDHGDLVHGPGDRPLAAG